MSSTNQQNATTGSGRTHDLNKNPSNEKHNKTLEKNQPSLPVKVLFPENSFDLYSPLIGQLSLFVIHVSDPNFICRNKI